ncbi:efflux RND transporter permease subunit [Halococcoides cellulosivorans]|uniref:RND transporter n=1 Tax=Halococcoides cellulosivorans TaxID=1679096 RepID=A0A2R4X4I0_9EURY|nr:MMPL family transporter [Halococcoides cellulosivorans]AWB28700.1 RND transporter [Halococcoides cellulosivorans]
MDFVEWSVAAADRLVVEHTRRVVIVGLLLTLVFGAGLGNLTTESGTSQFTEGSPSEEAFEAVNEVFGPTFSADTGSTTLIVKDRNVLSKPALLRLLTLQERLLERESLRITEASSVARSIAQTIDPEARTLAAQHDAIDRATAREIDRAVAELAARPGFSRSLSDDFNPESARASATIATVTHEVPAGMGSGAGTSGESPLQGYQTGVESVAERSPGDVTVFGQGVVAAEFQNVILDSLVIVVPAAVVLILLFLMVAYRDPVDLGLGVLALLMAIVWTFGAVGLLGIPFTQMLIAVPPLLLAVGIDYGIHTINRYREERVAGARAQPAMRTTMAQLLVAFGIVTGTTVIGFSANLTSDLGPIRDFGLVAAMGIVITFGVFGIFLPAAKLFVDDWLGRSERPAKRPLGADDTALGRVLAGGLVLARRAPIATLVVIALLTAGAAAYGTGVDTSFNQDDFLPPEDTPAILDRLPEPFAPSEYTVTGTISFIEDRFASDQQSSVTLYVEAPMRDPTQLEELQHVNRNPPPAFVATDREAEVRWIGSVIQSHAAASPAFARLVARNDPDGDGIPEQNLEAVYDALMDSPARQQATQYITSDYRRTRLVYQVDADASDAEISGQARRLAEDVRGDATATGQVVVFDAISATILQSAITSLVVALVGTGAFLLVAYRIVEGRATLGLVNLAPILVSLALIVGTMRALGMPLNALTATILSIAIGLGIDYSVHVVHRFADEYPERPFWDALEDTVRGTGGALTGSMVTTASGIGVLVIAITPILGQFGLVTAMAIGYSYLAAMIVTPSVLVVWYRARVALGIDRPAPDI